MRLLPILVITMAMVVSLHAGAFKRNSDYDYERDSRGDIDVACTINCAKWWTCRVSSFFMGKCDKPANCVCDEFAWEGRK
jgi:hypothetical protein